MMQPVTPCRGYVLCGGQSSRMGRDKALLPIGGRPLVVWTAELVQQVCGDVTLIGSRAKYSGLGFPLIEDVFPGQGPLSGIHAALVNSGACFSLVLGCDMPWVSKEFLDRLITIARAAAADATVPESNSFGYEPLCAVYAPGCLPAIEEAFRSGDVKVSRVLERVRLRVVTRDEWQPYDRGGKLFCNLNTTEEYEQAVADTRHDRACS